jgi:hypothetical protein
MSRGRARLGVAATIVGLLLLVATPAGAHGTSGPPASNFHTELIGLRPPTPGVTVGMGADGEQMVLRVSGPLHVTVLGYQDEPYLRVDARGVFENRSSPAVAMNRSRVPTGSASPTRPGPPRWVRISRQPVAQWHDHRVHWMGGVTPSTVQRDPNHAHVVERWTIPIRVNARAATARGTIRWVPAPAAWPWWVLAAALAVAVVLAARTGASRAVLMAAIAGMAVTETVHVWVSWPFSLGAMMARVGESLPSIAAVVVCLGALVWLARRNVWSAAPAVILAGLFVFVSGGLADLPTLSHAFVPSRLAPDLARAIVAVALGLGFGTALAGALRLRAPRPSS